MKKYSILPILLSSSLKIDVDKMISLVKSQKDIDAFILFSPFLEGNLFLLQEKISLYRALKENSDKEIIYEVSSYFSEEEKSSLKKLKPDSIFLTLLKDKNLSSKGHLSYVRNKMSGLNIPFYIHHEANMDSSYLSSVELNRLKRTNKYFKGVFEENNDYSAMQKYGYYDLEVFSGLKETILKPKSLKITGVCTDLFNVFNKEISEYYIEQDYQFCNIMLQDYLLFLESIIDLYPRGMAIKYLLNKTCNYPSYSRLPYYSLKGEEKDKLDYLF